LLRNQSAGRVERWRDALWVARASAEGVAAGEVDWGGGESSPSWLHAECTSLLVPFAFVRPRSVTSVRRDRRYEKARCFRNCFRTNVKSSGQ